MGLPPASRKSHVKAGSKRTVVIGIPAYRHASEDILGKFASAVPETYIRVICAIGAAPLIIPIDDDENMLKRLFGLIDGLMLIGGPDIDPVHYGQTACPGLRKVTPERDRVELTLADWALTWDMPLFCICRGTQVLNVAAGGTLWQDLASQVPQAAKHDWYPDYPEDHLSHEVRIEAASRVGRICGKAQLPVNSLHHQAIDRLGDGLRATAHAADGVVEAVESLDSRWVVGVQWHPEWLAENDFRMRALFEAFRDACKSDQRFPLTSP